MPRLRFGACLAPALAVTRSPMLSASASNVTPATCHREFHAGLWSIPLDETQPPVHLARLRERSARSAG